jgi:hypothetical protein
MTVLARRLRRSSEVLHRYGPQTGSMSRTLLLTGIAVVTLGVTESGAAVSSPSSMAAHHRHHGKFSCEAWGANLGGTTFAVANKVNSPCQNKHGRVNKAGRTVKFTKLGVVTANTELKGWRRVRAGTMGLASARTAKAVTRLLGTKALQIGVATSVATDRCVAKGRKLVLRQSVKSSVAYILISGKKTLIGSKPQKISLGPLGTIYFNRVIRSGHTLTVRAVEIDLGGKTPTVILAQSQVGFTGHPCATS